MPDAFLPLIAHAYKNNETQRSSSKSAMCSSAANNYKLMPLKQAACKIVADEQVSLAEFLLFPRV